MRIGWNSLEETLRRRTNENVTDITLEFMEMEAMGVM